MPRQAIEGRVQVDSIDVVSGSISFLPSEGNAGPAASTAIIEGVYRFAEDSGPYPGPHRVVVGVDLSKQNPAMDQRRGNSDPPGDGDSDATVAGGKLAPAQRTDPATDAVAAEPRSQWNTTFVVPDEGRPRKDFDFATGDP